MRLLFQLSFVVTALFVFVPEKANASCAKDSNGLLSITKGPEQQITVLCKADVQQLIGTTRQLGLCAEFPLTADASDARKGLSNCQGMLSEPIATDLSIGSSETINALAPIAGTYKYYFALASARSQFSSLFRFDSNITGGDGTRTPNSSNQNPVGQQAGSFCTGPSFEYTTQTILKESVRPNICSSSQPQTIPLSTLFWDNVGYSQWAGLTSVPSSETLPNQRNYFLDATAWHNVILLDENLNFITSNEQSANTEYVLLIEKLSLPIEVDENSNSFVFETTLSDAARISVGCVPQSMVGTPSWNYSTECVANTPYVGQINNLFID